MTKEALRIKMTLILMILVLTGITAGVALVRGPIDLRNRAAEPNKCEAAIATCTVGNINPQDFASFKIQIIDPSKVAPDNPLIAEGTAGEISVQTHVAPGKVYTCRVIGVTAGGTKRSDCPTNDFTVTAPNCSGPTFTPTPSMSTPTSTPSPSPTVTVQITPTPTGPVFHGCPINIRNIDPILCVIDAEGRCISGNSIPLACAEIRQWKTALTSEDKVTLEGYNLIYRLAVYDESGGIKATTPLNDTRDNQPDQTEVKFPAQTGMIYTSRLEVFDDTKLNPTRCSHISGRLRCTGITPTPATTFVRKPTPIVTTGTTTTTCTRSTGDLNLDGNVDVRDVNLFVRSQFSRDNLAAMDVNCDKKVDSADWSLLFTRVFGQ